MKVILNEDIANLGEEGDIKNVARGYARNYLIPNKLVLPYSTQGLAMLARKREALTRRREEKRTAALDVKTRLETEPLVLDMPAGDRGRLFGSVTSATIAEALLAKGIDIERKRIDIPDKTIKAVGTSYVRVRLYGDHEAELRVDVRVAGAAPPAAAPAAVVAAAPTTTAQVETDAASDEDAGQVTSADDAAEASADIDDSDE